MDIGWLQDFLTLADVRNFTKAAEKRNSSQAAFSRRVQALETWLGVSLVDRSIFPIELTSEGERFREHASDVLGQILDARISISQGSVSRHDHISLAMPHALATSSFVGWWDRWSNGLSLTCNVLPGNVGDAVNAMISGAADILIYYHNPQQPIHLDSRRYEQVRIGWETLRPYAARELVETQSVSLPPVWANQPVPLLMYGAESYLARMVDLILEARSSKIRRVRNGMSDMSEVLRELAVAGHGIAWIPESLIDPIRAEKLRVVGDESWSMQLSIMAYRDRSRDKAAVHRLWTQIKEHEQASTACGVNGQDPPAQSRERGKRGASSIAAGDRGRSTRRVVHSKLTEH
jgi:DNA-binding transcriptional LysR family regulator